MHTNKYTYIPKYVLLFRKLLLFFITHIKYKIIKYEN